MPARSPQTDDGFRHQAFFYTSEREFVTGASAFVPRRGRGG